jgi:hypothetical protein
MGLLGTSLIGRIAIARRVEMSPASPLSLAIQSHRQLHSWRHPDPEIELEYFLSAVHRKGSLSRNFEDSIELPNVIDHGAATID